MCSQIHSSNSQSHDAVLSGPGQANIEDSAANLIERQNPSTNAPLVKEVPFARSSRVQMLPLAPLDVGQRPSTPSHRRLSYGLPSSPRSPRLHGSSSQIFERDVQEDIRHIPTSPSIPSHLRTENHIPPVLGPSSVVLTDDKFDPDSIEIVTHNLHHAAVPSSHDDSASIHPADNDDSVSIPEHSDVRRLSFVSFADVIHGEHAEMEALPNGDSVAGSALSPLSPHSFIRRTKSSHFNTPPSPSDTSLSPNAVSPTRSLHSRGYISPAASAQSAHLHGLSGEFNIETMRQALRRSESQDFGGFRSHSGNTA
ncbi:hypothetical protein AAP_03579 [Ascosphaera apis ARSEF 7405]|uniref:Uncharacterized protein n=1 Tax=Ascosphaera apis ARSEF 7405 TaxID=392613 RepID=A0A167Y721_9EURO|nr:hypothetical protein AAP_03579 [Ascosphaera apis ARSEF 7405]